MSINFIPGDMSANKSRTLLPQLFLSFLTPAMMVSKMSGEKLINLLEDVGKTSEEIFRGERLPLLKDHYFDS